MNSFRLLTKSARDDQACCRLYAGNLFAVVKGPERDEDFLLPVRVMFCPSCGRRIDQGRLEGER